jgi:putative transposase
VICRFISAERNRFGVASICRALSANGIQIAPRTYHAWMARPPSKRSLWDITVTEVLAGYYLPDKEGRKKPESLYGVVKMWAHLHREGIPVAKSTVERLMRINGWQGVRRCKRVRTTIGDPTATRAPDLVKRRFFPTAPCQLLVADFTYVPLTSGVFCYVAFVIDAYAGLIVGWETSLSKEPWFVEQAIRHAIDYRYRQRSSLTGAIHHSDAGSQYTAVHFAETAFLAGLTLSIGTVGDALDNALAETTIGLYKTECVRSDSPFRRGPLATRSDVEAITAEWVDWYNNHRLSHRLGRIPPAEAEARYHANRTTGRQASTPETNSA